MALLGIHHTSFTVTDLERTVKFYRDVVGLSLLGRKHRSAPDLGTALRGPDAAEAPGESTPGAGEMLIADMGVGEARIEFIQYLQPPSARFAGDPSVGGSGHVALLTDDIDREYRRLREAGVSFHTPPRTVQDPGKPVWRWCYFRDPDGICVELVESGAPESSHHSSGADAGPSAE